MGHGACRMRWRLRRHVYTCVLSYLVFSKGNQDFLRLLSMRVASSPLSRKPQQPTSRYDSSRARKSSCSALKRVYLAWEAEKFRSIGLLLTISVATVFNVVICHWGAPGEKATCSRASRDG